jgi:4-hydroxy-3-polyprenylbenzoate decarboxylase
MGGAVSYRSMRECVQDLEKHGHLVRIQEALDPHLEMAEVHRRVFQARGPAILFEKVKGSPFAAVSNLFGTLARSRFIFRASLKRVKRLVELNADPMRLISEPKRFLGLWKMAFHVLPQKVASGPVMQSQTTVDKLPQIVCWPEDGGAFILLPQVYTEDPGRPDVMHSNLGMYRIQLSGNDYQPNREIGLHYQIRRDIGIHHTRAVTEASALPISVFVGGPPAHSFAAVMPLPEGVPEVVFAGGLAGRRFRYVRQNGFVVSAEADFCIVGTVAQGEERLEGPFGDHLGYYSLRHPFPFIRVAKIYHRPDAIWPFTVVGRPPQEDTSFGRLIHDITGPMVPKSLPGISAVHAVDAAGVHPLLLAIGRERYLPYQERMPRELLTLANAVLGFGHCSLAKYLFIVAQEDNPDLDIHAIKDFFIHVLERVDWRRDLHFQTRTTIDTLDYSGSGLNSGSKVVVAAAGDKKRALAERLPSNLDLADGFSAPCMVMPGIMVVQSPVFNDTSSAQIEIERLIHALIPQKSLAAIPLIVLVDDSEFAARNLNNFLWITFTRSNPSHDIHGLEAFIQNKHWGCRGSLIIDARHKPHHAPPLIEDPRITRRVDDLAARGGPLYGII